MLALLALAATAAACSSGPQVTAQQKRAVAGILQAPKGSTSPSPTRRTTNKTTTTTTAPGATPTSTSVGPGRASSPPTSNAAGAGTSPSSGQAGSAPTTAAAGAPPNVVGQSLPTAENQLGTAGYSANAQPWGGSCTAAGQVMQQVPPQGSTVQLFYCTKVT